MHSYREEKLNNTIGITTVGGDATSSRCGLVSLSIGGETYNTYTNVGFVKCYIID